MRQLPYEIIQWRDVQICMLGATDPCFSRPVENALIAAKLALKTTQFSPQVVLRGKRGLNKNIDYISTASAIKYLIRLSSKLLFV